MHWKNIPEKNWDFSITTEIVIVFFAVSIQQSFPNDVLRVTENEQQVESESIIMALLIC